MIWHPWKLFNFQYPHSPLSIYVQNSSTLLTLDVQFQTNPIPLQMITNQLKENTIQGWLFRVFHIVKRGGGVNRKFWESDNFFTGWQEPEERFWPFEPSSKLKTAFCEYKTSIKIKISMTCVYKEYEIKTKMLREHWLQLKMKFLLGYEMKIVI